MTVLLSLQSNFTTIGVSEEITSDLCFKLGFHQIAVGCMNEAVLIDLGSIESLWGIRPERAPASICILL
jgi:hypothetical protein